MRHRKYFLLWYTFYYIHYWAADFSLLAEISAPNPNPNRNPDPNQARQELHKFVPVVQRWARTFLPRAPPAGAPPPPPPAPLPETENMAQRARAFRAAGLPSGALRVARVLATEQQLVSHTYGLKGTVDVVLAAEVLDPHGTPTHQVPLPLELGLGLGLGLP